MNQRVIKPTTQPEADVRQERIGVISGQGKGQAPLGAIELALQQRKPMNRQLFPARGEEVESVCFRFQVFLPAPGHQMAEQGCEGAPPTRERLKLGDDALGGISVAGRDGAISCSPTQGGGE